MRIMQRLTCSVLLATILLAVLGCGGGGSSTIEPKTFGTAAVQGDAIVFTATQGSVVQNVTANFVNGTVTLNNLPFTSDTQGAWRLDLTKVTLGTSGMPPLPPPPFAPYQPDIKISKPDTTFLGDNVYETPSGTYTVTVYVTANTKDGFVVSALPVLTNVVVLTPGVQLQSKDAVAGGTVAYTLNLQHDGIDPDDIPSTTHYDKFVMTGPASGDGWTIRYIDWQGNDITTAVTKADGGSGWLSGNVAEKGFTPVTVEVTPAVSQPTNAAKMVMVTVTSYNEPSRRDACWLKTTVQ